ncbi:hypothetical protein [uncultured Psychrobacter sp.]|uniref:hypothetical protein n=1 Tax=uncultured Psychrobacter sp. TaxID=259303 RepID=UPI0030D94A99
MFDNSTKTVKVPLFTLANLPADIQKVAYEEWAEKVQNGLADSKEAEQFKGLLDGLCEGFGFVLSDKHGELYYTHENYDHPFVGFDEVIKDYDQGWSINSGDIDPSFLKNDSKEEAARYLSSLIENESDIDNADKYTKLWGESINEKYQEKLKLLNADTVGTHQHFNTTIEAMQEGFECTFNVFIADLKALSSKEAFEEKTGSHAVFLANGSLFNIAPDLYYQDQ